MPYPMASVRGKNFGSAALVSPWYLSGGVGAANCIQAYRAKGAADAATSYVNLANPGVYTLTATSAPTFNTATGWTFNGSVNYLLVGGGTGIIWATSPVSIVVRMTLDGTAAYRCHYGGESSSIHYRISDAHKQQFLLGNLAQIGQSTSVVPSSDQVIAVTYTAAGVCTFYLGGSPDGTATDDRSFVVDNDFIGQGASTHFFKGVIAALSTYNIALSAAEVLAISTAMAAL